MKMKLLVLLILGIWTGMVLGISFLEAPLKFQAPNITTILGLGIGKIVYPLSDFYEINIAENSVALGHDTDNRYKIMNIY